MLKPTLTTAEFQALADDLQAHYKLDPTGQYTIDLGANAFITDKDPAGLFTALEKERAELKRVKAIADQLEEKVKESEITKLKTTEEVTAHFTAELEKMKAQQAEKEKAQAAELLEQKTANAKRLASEQALAVASSMFGTNAALMLPHVERSMLGSIDSNGNPIVQIVDPSTNLPVVDQNLDNFKKTLSTNPLFKSMVVVSNASGGSANDDGTTSSASNATNDGKPKKLSDYTSDELVAIKKSDPEQFNQLLSSKD